MRQSGRDLWLREYGTRLVCSGLLILGLTGSALAQDPGTVTLPLTTWDALRTAGLETEHEAPESVMAQSRTITGSFSRGVFSGTLTATFVVRSDEPIRVPLLDGDTSIASVSLDGQTTSLLSEHGMYTIGVDTPGEHTATVRFFAGERNDRFTRQLAFGLPDAGTTRLEIAVPEADIEASLAHGVITATRSVGGTTMLTGHLDGQGIVDLSWRSAEQASLAPARLSAEVNTLFTLQEGLVRGVSEQTFSVLEGAVERLTLSLPDGVEVVDVTGDSVLQWRAGDVLEVRTRYPVTDAVKLQVHFQVPAAVDGPVSLPQPLPDGVPFAGTAGVQGPAGVTVEVATLSEGTALPPRDFPAALTALTRSPLLMGFAFDTAPSIALAVSRNEEVELIGAIVDDIQASTVLIEDGTEATKARLRVRNRSRQYLRVSLPEGAVLTHALLDGEPVRPAVEPGGSLLVPLRQSERLQGQTLRHTVAPGETLGGIAVLYYSDPALWRTLLEANPDQLAYAEDLTIGMALQIPPPEGVVVRESSFVIELAWSRQLDAMGHFGSREVSLPLLDADTNMVTWHLYVPDAFTTLDIDANLTSYSHIHYDPFRRMSMFLERAKQTRSAWAGGEYRSILKSRRTIYKEEAGQRSGEQDVFGSFPLVGEQHRFKRLLLGQETARVSVTYLDRRAKGPIRILSLLASMGLVSLMLNARRWSVHPRQLQLIAAVGMAGLLVVAHSVLGVHRRLLWGADLALLLWLMVDHRGALVAWMRSRRIREGLLSWRLMGRIFGAWIGLQVILAFPLFLSSFALIVLLAAHRRLS
ncbi:MAG: nucleoid-associated protein YgaU [Myxococcota bacterium]|jgi:nucleoid-associated protein YgaU